MGFYDIKAAKPAFLKVWGDPNKYSERLDPDNPITGKLKAINKKIEEIGEETENEVLEEESTYYDTYNIILQKIASKYWTPSPTTTRQTPPNSKTCT
jgi:hypothetical protein